MMKDQWSQSFMRVAIGLGALLVGGAALISAVSSIFHYQDMGESTLGGDWVMRVNNLTGDVSVCSNRFGCSGAVVADQPAASGRVPAAPGNQPRPRFE